MPDQKVLDMILEIEWEMFSAVNEGGPKAACQEDRKTFEGMRLGQFNAWSEAAAVSYLEDLKNAVAAERNLVMEKYIHMMKYATPIQYGKLEHLVTLPDEKAVSTVKKISDKMIEQTKVLFTAFPYVSGSGRPLYATHDLGGVTSVETYQKGELLTYSAKTLSALYEHILALEKEGISFAYKVLENSVKFYGYESLDKAEAATKARIDSLPIECSLGCSNCDSDSGYSCGMEYKCD